MLHIFASQLYPALTSHPLHTPLVPGPLVYHHRTATQSGARNPYRGPSVKPQLDRGEAPGGEEEGLALAQAITQCSDARPQPQGEAKQQSS